MNRVWVAMALLVAIFALAGCGQDAATEVDRSNDLEQRLVEPSNTAFPSNQLAAIDSVGTYTAECSRAPGAGDEYSCRILKDPPGISGNPEAEGETRWRFTGDAVSRLAPGGDLRRPPAGADEAARIVDAACESRSASSPQSMATSYPDGTYCHTDCEASAEAGSYLCALAFEGNDLAVQAVGYQEWKWNNDGTVAHEYNRGDLSAVKPRKDYAY